MGGIIAFVMGCGATYIVMTNPEIANYVGKIILINLSFWSMVGDNLMGK